MTLDYTRYNQLFTAESERDLHEITLQLGGSMKKLGEEMIDTGGTMLRDADGNLTFLPRNPIVVMKFMVTFQFAIGICDCQMRDGALVLDRIHWSRTI